MRNTDDTVFYFALISLTHHRQNISPVSSGTSPLSIRQTVISSPVKYCSIVTVCHKSVKEMNRWKIRRMCLF